MQITDDIICEIFTNIADEALNLADLNNKKTISSREVSPICLIYCFFSPSAKKFLDSNCREIGHCW
jgi:hypothetical protein